MNQSSYKVYAVKRSGDMAYVATVRADNGHGAILKARTDALDDGLPLKEGDYAAVAEWGIQSCHVYGPQPDEKVPVHLS